MKLRYWILIGFVAIVAIVAAGAAVLLETQAGLRWAAVIVARHSGGALEIGAAHGKLAGPLTLERVRLALPDAVIEVRHLELDWHPGALAAGKLDIVHLRGSGVRITTRAGEETSSGLPQRLELPLHVIVAEARFKNIVLKMPDRELRLTRLDFALDASDARIRLSKLKAHGPRIALDGEVDLQPHDDWPLEATLATVLRPPDYPPIAGRTRLRGELRKNLELEQTLSEPFRAQLEATISTLFDQPKLRGTLHVAQLDPHALNAKWPALRAGADLELAGTLERFRLRGQASLAAPAAYTVNLSLAAGVAGQQIRIDNLNLALLGQPDRVALHGRVNVGTTPTADLAVAWKNLSWPLSGTNPTITMAAGEAHVQGGLGDWTLAGKTRLQAHGLPQGSWTFTAHGNRKTLTLASLDGKWLGGTIAARGTAALAGERPFSLTARVRNVQAHAVSTRLRGQVGFDLAASGKLKPLQAKAQVSHLVGRLQGRPVTGNADLAYADDTVIVHTLNLAVGANRFDAEGRWGSHANLKWRLQAPKLAELGAGLGGRLEAKGTVSGAADAPRIQASLAGEQLRWDDLRIARAHAQADIDLAQRTAPALDLHLEGIERGDLVIQRLDATLEGPANAQRFLIAVSGNQGDIRLAGSGRLDHERWVGKLDEGSLIPARGPRFDLGAPAPLTLGRDKMQLGQSCWLGPQNAEFCLAAASGSKGWNAALDLKRLPLALADPWLSDAVVLKGELGGTLTAAGGAGQLNVQADVRVGQGSVTRSFAGKEQSLEFDEIALNARLDPANATGRLGVTLADGGTLNATADIPWRAHVEPAGKLHLVAHLPDLSGMGALSDAVSNVSGRLDADLTVSGSLDAPDFQGNARLGNAAATLTRFGTRIQNGDLALSGAGAGIRLTGRVEDGHGGRLNVRGSLERGANEWALAAHVQGKNFRAVDMPEARVAVSPDFDLGVRDRAVTLDGAVIVPSAQITPPHFSNAIAPTPDLVIVGEEKTTGALPWQLHVRLNVRLGDDVHFDGYGLSARIGGEITLHETPGKLTTASGELKILDGHYKAYGQDLAIQRGRLLFSGGPIANPGLDIRATRSVGTVTAGLMVNGTLRNPRLRVFSHPPMSQSDALAYLLFGHAVQQNSRAQNSTLNRAANAIGLAGGTYIVKSLGKHVGVDTVSVENASDYGTNANQASLFLGKYLSPRLYVSYGIGLYAPINLLRVRYTLSRHWALEAESGSISGADILYNIEY